MSSFSSLNTAMTGLQAHKRAIDVIGHNIANVNTDGYSRRRVELEPSVGMKSSSRYDTEFSWNNLGVNIADVHRVRDSFLDMKARASLAGSAQASKLDAILGGVEATFPEPSDTAIAGQLAGLWSAFADAANQPGSLPQREAVLAQAATVVSSIRKAADDLRIQHRDLSDQLSITVDRVNTLAQQVADLNSQIRAASASGMDAGDLADSRDLVIDELTRLTGATTRSGEFNQVDVMLGGSTLVAEGRISPLRVVNTGPLDPPLNNLQVQEVQLQWAKDGYPVAGFGGEVGAMVQGLDDVIPRYMHELDQIAGGLVATVNTIHASGQGQNPLTDVGLNFFDPAFVRADNIRISADIDGQPSRLALGTVGGGPLDGSIGHQLGAVGALATGPDAMHRAMIGRLGVEAQTATTRAATQQRFVVEAENQRTAVSGVNLDEEMTNLVMSQRAYESSARLLSTVDEMLDTLINRTAV